MRHPDMDGSSIYAYMLTSCGGLYDTCWVINQTSLLTGVWYSKLRAKMHQPMGQPLEYQAKRTISTPRKYIRVGRAPHFSSSLITLQ